MGLIGSPINAMKQVAMKAVTLSEHLAMTRLPAALSHLFSTNITEIKPPTGFYRR